MLNDYRKNIKNLTKHPPPKKKIEEKKNNIKQ